MKEERGGGKEGRSAICLRTKLKIQNFPMLDALLKIKTDVAVANQCHKILETPGSQYNYDFGDPLMKSETPSP